jgi:hypothetical protein
MLCLMPRQSPLSLIHLVSEPNRLFFIPIRSVAPLERIHEPAVPKRGDAVFRVQVFPIRAVHERRIAENREIGKREGFCTTRTLLSACTMLYVSLL